MTGWQSFQNHQRGARKSGHPAPIVGLDNTCPSAKVGSSLLPWGRKRWRPESFHNNTRTNIQHHDSRCAHLLFDQYVWLLGSAAMASEYLAMALR